MNLIFFTKVFLHMNLIFVTNVLSKVNMIFVLSNQVMWLQMSF